MPSVSINDHTFLILRAKAVKHVLGERNPSKARIYAEEHLLRCAVEPQPAGDMV